MPETFHAQFPVSVKSLFKTGYRQTGPFRRSNSFFRPKSSHYKVAIIKTKSAAIAFFSIFSFFPSRRSFSFSFPFPSCLLSFSVDVLVSAPPLLAFQLFAGQTIQLLYFCPKNEVVVVVVVCSFL